MKKLLSVVLALLMLAVMLPVTAMADDIPILGSDKVWKNVNPKNVQDVLVLLHMRTAIPSITFPVPYPMSIPSRRI